MDDCWFDEVESWSVVATLAEVWVLVYCTWDETGDFGGGLGVGAEDEGE